MQMNKVLYEDYTGQICWRKDKRLQRNMTYSSCHFRRVSRMERVATVPNVCTMLVILIFVSHFSLRSKIGKIFCNSFGLIGFQP